MARDKTNRIVVYQLNSTEKFDELDLTKKDYVLDYVDGTRKLFVQRSKSSTPQWVDYIAPLLNTHTVDIVNENCSFILFAKRANNVYALAGGYGWTQLAGHVDDEFGLQVSLRMIDERAISAISQRAMKGTTRQVFRAVAGYDPVFDRDNYNRVLKSLEGRGNFEGRTFRVTGRSCLVLRTGKTVRELDSVLDEIEYLMAREPKTHFPRSYEEIKDKDLIAELNNERLDRFKSFWSGDSDRETLYLEFEDPILQFRCERFQVLYKRNQIEVEDFDLDGIRSAFWEKDIKDITECGNLKNFRVTGINESGYPIVQKETFANILVSELTKQGCQYIRLGKRWYKILDEIQDFLNTELRKVNVDSSLLPLWDREQHSSEIEYNRFVAERNGWACMDQDFVQVEGYSKLELCDIYDSEAERFFHVKATWGCKSAYLFTQGVTAAQSYRESKVFRDKCREKWPTLFGNEPLGHTVVFGVANNNSLASEFPVNMSYFAKLSLYQAITQLKAYDYETVLAPIAMH